MSSLFLFWRKSTGEVLSMIESPFRTEEELESYLDKTRELLRDLFIIKRQVRIPTGGILDLIALDKAGSVVIVELKNTPLSQDVISQVVSYATWAEENPDSIRAMWFELKDRPEDINVSWENLKVKVLIVAPAVPLPVIRMAKRIMFPVQFLEVRKFSVDKDDFILVNQVQVKGEPEAKTGVTRGLEAYDKEFYMNNYNKASVAKFFETINIVDNLVDKRDWKLRKKMNKGFVSYKFGSRVVFGATWIGTKSFGMFFKVPRKESESIVVPGLTPHRYEDEWKQVLYKVEQPESDIKKLLPAFEAAYRHVTGIEQ